MTKKEDPEDDEPLETPETSPKANLPAKKRRKPSKDSDTRYKVIRAALEEHLIEHARKHDGKKKSLDEVNATLEEFLDSYIILGYDYTGEAVTLISANTQQQADSLSTLIQKFVVSSASNSSGPPFYE